MTDDSPQKPVSFRLPVRTCSLLAAGTGFVALLGWVLQLPFLTNFGSGKIPMPLSTALLFVLYGIAIFLCAHLPMHRGAYRVGLLLNIAGTLVVLPLFFLSILGILPTVEHFGFPITGTVGGTPIGHMSPVTALCFLVASLSFLALPPSLKGWDWRAKASWWLASLLVATSFVFLLAYLFGTPLFYDGPFIPPAATTSIAFVALGIAQLGLTLPHARFHRRQEEQVTRTEYGLLLIFLLLATGIVTVGYLYHQNYERRYRNEVESKLSAIAELKVSEMVQYRKERLGAAAVFFRNASFSSMVRRFLEQPGDAGARQQLRAWIGNYGAQYESDRVFLLDALGVTRISVPETPESVPPIITQRASEIMRLGQVAFQDFHRNEYNRKIYLAILVPILDEREGRRPLGVLALRIDPERYLYPLIRHWPTPSRTAETLLVRRDENDVLFLNELRFRKNTALTRRLPLDPGSESPAVKVVLGKRGIVEGRDYRGKPVLADVREVPDSPWFVVARMDLSELYEPEQERFWWTVSLVCVMLLAAGTGVGLAWRQQREHFYRERYEAERERTWLQDVISRSSNEIYVFDPLTLRFKFVNKGGLRNIGYSMEELAAMTPIDIEPEYTEEAFRAMVQPLVSGEREVLVFETVQRRKDGSDYPVEVHLQLVSAAGGVVFLAIINDIIERKRAEEEQTKLVSLVEMSRDFIGIASLEGKVTYLNNAALALVGLADLQEARGRLIFEFYAESHLPQAREEMIVSVQKDGYWYGETRFKHFRTGDPIDVEMAGFKILGKRGDPISLATVSRDITERKRAEEERRKLEQQFQTTQKLESLGILAGGIAHEIRNPLSSVNISISSIERACGASTGLEPDTKEKIDRILEQMKSAAAKMGLVVQRVMDYSKPFPPRRDTVDLNKVIEEAVRLSLSTLRKREIAVLKDLAPDLATCRVDAQMIEQVLVNLITNASQAMEGAEGAKLLEVASAVQDGRIVLRVSDSGPGVPPSLREKVFDPFFTTRKDGSGIGLSFSHRIIADHGGSLRVGTSRWGGAEFRIEFPASREGVPG